MTSLLKVGLMGFGFAGATFHTLVIAHSGRTRVAAIATKQPDKARAAYSEAAVVADFDALRELAKLDCAVIATPNYTHFDLGRGAHAGAPGDRPRSGVPRRSTTAAGTAIFSPCAN